MLIDETEVTALTLKTATADLLLRIFDSHAQKRKEDWTTQSKIIKNTVQRKNPIVQQKINQVNKQKGTPSRASTLDKLAVVPSVIQSQDPPDSAEYETWIRQRPNRQKINQFDQHVKILEEQFIGKEIDVPVMSQRKVPTTQTGHREWRRCIRCNLSTQFTTFSRTGRGKCRAKAQFSGKIQEMSVVMQHRFP